MKLVILCRWIRCNHASGGMSQSNRLAWSSTSSAGLLNRCWIPLCWRWQSNIRFLRINFTHIQMFCFSCFSWAVLSLRMMVNVIWIRKANTHIRLFSIILAFHKWIWKSNRTPLMSSSRWPHNKLVSTRNWQITSKARTVLSSLKIHRMSSIWSRNNME